MPACQKSAQLGPVPLGAGELARFRRRFVLFQDQATSETGTDAARPPASAMISIERKRAG